MIGRYLTTNQAAELVGMHPETIRIAIREQSLKARQSGPKAPYRISSNELEKWFNARHKPA